MVTGSDKCSEQRWDNRQKLREMAMKRASSYVFLKTFLLAAYVLGAVSGWAGPATADPEKSTLQKVLERGYVIVGVRDTTPGFGFRNEKGELVGFDIDLARE